ncbi:glutathione S-transferase kappa 1-like [Ruditapes philippinarum]|uniref:glutathione S-transferase kappa 1-like n=1 Tax=Ruditapes philippinarum TaxID=129788 RepID=UPI00295BFEF0|nr:glutathione S-transferase kappa 1-like [Ruditapes philippinarum]
MAAPTRKTVELFYDVVSPYSWFAFEVLCRYKNVWNIELKLKPFFLGGIMNEASNRPPAMVPNKGKYMFKEMQLLAKYYNVPLVPPKDPAEVMFNKGSLSAQRFITAVDLMDSSKVEPLSRELWMRIWSRDEDIVDPDSLQQAGQKAGLGDEQVKSCLQKMKDQAVKERLKQYTSEALEYEAFGSPTIIAHVKKPVMLFGSDRFPILAQVLNEKWDGPIPGSKL